MPSASCQGVGAPALSMPPEQAKGTPRNIMGAIMSRFGEAAAAGGVEAAKSAELKSALRDVIKDARHAKGENKAAAVGDAVAKVLRDYGVDAEAFMKALAPKGHRKSQPMDPAPTVPTTPTEPPVSDVPVEVEPVTPLEAGPMSTATIDVLA